jgi:hypothetical protein
LIFYLDISLLSLGLFLGLFGGVDKEIKSPMICKASRREFIGVEDGAFISESDFTFGSGDGDLDNGAGNGDGDLDG